MFCNGIRFNGAETDCGIARILGILRRMNSWDTQIYFLATIIICSLSTLNYSRIGRLVAPHTTKTRETRQQQYSPSVRLSSPHRNILQSTNQTIQAPQSKATSTILKLKIVYVYHKTSLGLREGGWPIKRYGWEEGIVYLGRASFKSCFNIRN